MIPTGAVLRRFGTASAFAAAAATVRQKMLQRRETTRSEKTVHVTIAGAANHVELAEGMESGALLQVAAPAQVEGGNRVVAQHQHMFSVQAH